MYFHIPVNDAVVYVDVPCRGVLKSMVCTACTATVAANDTIVASRGATAVNTWTAVNGDGLVREEGTPDTTNKDLVFDPDSATEANKKILLTPTGAPGLVMCLLGYDPYATVVEAPALA